MTALELTRVLGKEGTLRGNRDNPLTVGVRVKDARIRFGRMDFLVSPLSGSGEVWVESDRVTLAD